MIRKVLAALVLVVGVPLAGLALIEGGASAWLLVRDVRNIQPDANFRNARYDSLLGWVGAPDLHVPDRFSPGVSLTNNADGMRVHRPVTPALPAGTRRIICSGDSFTNGWGVGDADTFCARLEALLPGVETLNMAQPGYGIDQAYLWYKRDAVRWPHQVHLFAFISNDFERMSLTSFTGYSKPILHVKNGGLVVDNVPPPSWTGSSRYEIFSRALPRLRLTQLLQRGVDNSETALLARAERLVWDVSEAVFRDLDRLNKERGSQLVLVYLPTNAELVPSPYDARRARLAAFAERANITLLDLVPAIRQVPVDTLPWFFLTNNQLQANGAAGHYTARGHQWVAEQLALRLRELPPFVKGRAP